MKVAFKYLLFMTLVLGIAYPLLMTGLAQVFFSGKANGSLVKINEKTVGSYLIAQSFQDPKFFWPRPSAVNFNAMASGASNWGPTSQDLQTMIAERKAAGATGDLLYSSGSGLDPHISPSSAQSQFERIAKARNFTALQKQALFQLIKINTEDRQFGVLGEPRINVLKINIALSKL